MPELEVEPEKPKPAWGGAGVSPWGVAAAANPGRCRTILASYWPLTDQYCLLIGCSSGLPGGGDVRGAGGPAAQEGAQG